MTVTAGRRLSSMLAVTLLFFGQAQAAENKPFYVGANAGVAFGDVDGYSPTHLVGVGPLKSAEDSIGKTAEGSWRIYAGYRLNDYVDTEVSYANLGTFERRASRATGTSTFVPLIGNVADQRCIDEAFETSVLGASLLLHPGYDSGFYGKLGVGFWETETATRSAVRTGGLFSGLGVTSCGGAARRTSTDSGTELSVGAGWRLSAADWAVRGEIERIGGIVFSPSGEAAIYTISISAEYRF